MAKSKIAITVDETVLARLDLLVRIGRYSNRSQAFEAAAKADWEQDKKTRLARACALLDAAEIAEMVAMAEEGLEADVADWPEY